MNNLLQCPFCGGKATYQEFYPLGLGDYEPEHNFTCDGCPVLVVMVDISTDEAIGVYNQRFNAPERAKG